VHGFPEVPPGGPRKVTTLGNQCGSSDAEKEDLSAQVERVARTNDRPLAPNAVHSKLAAAYALDVHAVVVWGEYELPA
jgi:hypothetical protein